MIQSFTDRVRLPPDSGYDYTTKSSLECNEKLSRLLILVIIAVILSGCGTGSINKKIEKAVMPKLPELIGPAEQYTVKADCSISGLLDHRVDTIKIKGINVLVGGKYPVDTLDIYMSDVKINPDTQAVKGIKAVQIEAVLSEGRLLDFLQRQHPAWNINSLHIGNNTATIVGHPEYLGISAKIEAIGKLKISGPARVDFIPDRVKMGGIPAPDLLVQQALKLLNPVLSLEEWKIPIQLTGVELLSGKVTLNATGNLENGLPDGLINAVGHKK